MNFRLVGLGFIRHGANEGRRAVARASIVLGRRTVAWCIHVGAVEGGYTVAISVKMRRLVGIIKSLIDTGR